MNRLRKLTQIATVAVSIVLLAVDPAAACRLLGNRRCCCCCPCPTATCTQSSAGQPAEPGEPSPSDVPPAPPAAASDGHPSTPLAPLAADAPAVDATQSQPQSAAPNSGATLILGTNTPPIPAAQSPTRSPTATIIEPTITPPASPPATRQPVRISTPAGGSVAPPADASANLHATPPSSTPPAPMPTTLRQPQHAESSTNRSTATVANPAPAIRPTDIEPTQPLVPRRASDPPMPPLNSSAGAVTRSPAQPARGGTRAPVNPPAFAPVADDPFAPSAPARQPQPADDDPFAPLAPVVQPQSKPSAPLAAEPTTLKFADSLVPGSDGRLPIRDWSDDSGTFRVRAKLVLILDGKVRLLKETGRTTTVPVDRLSANDQAYVNEVITRYGQDLTKLDQLAAR